MDVCSTSGCAEAVVDVRTGLCAAHHAEQQKLRLAAGEVPASRIEAEVARARQIVEGARAELRRGADAVVALEGALR